MSNAQKYMELQAAANRATDAWLANDSEANHAAMRAADDALQAAKAAGWNKIELAPAIVDDMMSRSVFGTADRLRAVDQVPAAARVTAADLAIQRGITGRIRAGALAELENLVDPSVDMPIYHDAEFLRAEIRRVVDQARADIEAAKAEYLARAA